MHGAHDLLHSAPDDAARLAARLRLRKKEEQRKLPPDAVDLVVEDVQAEEEEQIRQRRRGEPGGKKTRVYRLAYVPPELRGRDEGADTPDAEQEQEGQREGDEVRDAVPGESAQVKDVVERDEELDGPLPAANEGATDGRGEVVRVVVEEDERQARQAGVDERPRSVEDKDNPWR